MNPEADYPGYDDLSSAGGTDGDDCIDLDLDDPNSPVQRRQYKSFQPNVKLQPTDVIFKEENSRAAPRKGVEPKAFLTIGETRRESLQYVGRSQPGTAPQAQHKKTTQLVTSARNYAGAQRSSSAPNSRARTANNRTPSGRRSFLSTPGYTPLPVAPPQAPPTRENTYLHYPFKQSLYEEAIQQPVRQHKLNSMEAFLDYIAKQHLIIPSPMPGCRPPVSPGEGMKQATILATMEVGRLINHRENTPQNTQQTKPPRLLKARLKPLGTVQDVGGPMIYQCAGIRADKRNYGPSLMKMNKQQQLENMIQKSAALKEMSASSFGRNGTSKARNPSVFTCEKSIRSETREPTPSLYNSHDYMQLYAEYLRAETNLNELVDEDTVIGETEAELTRQTISSQDEERAKSAASSVEDPLNVSHGRRHPESRSVSAVTIKRKETDTPVNKSSSAKDSKSKTSSARGITFLTEDQPSRASSQGTNRKPVTNLQEKSGCKDFGEIQGNHDTDKDDESKDRDNQVTKVLNTITWGDAPVTQTQNSDSDSNKGTTNRDNKATDRHDDDTVNDTHFHSQDSINTNHSRADFGGANRNHGKRAQRPTPSSKTQCADTNVFITAGFLSLESMISDARSVLRRSYSLDDLSEGFWEGAELSSPRSIEVLNKEVTFADNEELFYYEDVDSDFESEVNDFNLTPNNYMQLEVYDSESLNLESDLPVADEVIEQPRVAASVSCTDKVWRELARRQSCRGEHGEISEFLTHRSLVREIVPGKARILPEKLSISFSVPALTEPVGPPPTPAPSFVDDKSFLEQLVDLLPEPKKADPKPKTLDLKPEAVIGESKRVEMKPNPAIVEPVGHLAPVCFRINAIPEQDTVYYFTYGEHMNKKRLQAMLNRSELEAFWAVLFGFQLIFNKKGLDKDAGSFPNLEVNPYSSTEGMIYRLNAPDIPLIDSWNGYPLHYARVLLPVWMCNSNDPDHYGIAQYCVPAVTYIAQNDWIKDGTEAGISHSYSLTQCLKGMNSLTPNYQNHLSSLLSCN